MALALFMVLTFIPASVMAEGEEAKIGDTLYPTVKEALAAATSGQTVELLKDVETSTGYTVPDGVTLDGAGKKVTLTAEVNGITLYGASKVTNLTVETGERGKYAVHAYITSGAVISNVTIVDKSVKWAGIQVNGGSATVSGINYQGSSYAVIELAKGDGVTGNPVVTVDGSITSSDANVSSIYVDVEEIPSPVVDQLVKVTDNANGMLTPDSKLEFGDNGHVVVTEPVEPEKPAEPSAPACAGEKDKNCDGVVTCEEEKGEGWTWNNSTKVCEFTGSTGYTVVNTAAK